MSRRGDERGFVLSLVIFAVAALSIAGTALFLVVQSEGAMATTGAESSNAYHLARAGLARYMGESFGRPVAERTWEMGGGTVTVTAERVIAGSPRPAQDVYLITSSAEVGDPRRPTVASRRSVRQFAILDRQPFDVPGAFTMPSGDIELGGQATIGGLDQAAPEDCELGGTSVGGIGAIAGARAIDESRVSGDPDPVVYETSRDALLERRGLDWPLLTDPSTPFDHDFEGGVPPLLFTLVSPDFRTIRVQGNLSANWLHRGRGLLVVEGELRISDGFAWDGAVIAGSIRSNTNSDFEINGALIAGVDEAASGGVRFTGRADIDYNSCNVLRASEGLAVLRPMPGTRWHPQH